MQHPDQMMTARAALVRQDIKDALYLVGRACAHFRNGMADDLPLTDEDRNNLADALDALNQLNRSLQANGHPTAQEVA